MDHFDASLFLRAAAFLGLGYFSFKRGSDAIRTGRAYRSLGVSSADRSDNPFSFWLLVAGYFSGVVVALVLLADAFGLLEHVL